MIYKNKERVVSICEEIEKHMGTINDLCEATAVSVVDIRDRTVLAIAVGESSADEYTLASMIMINFIKDDLECKIADLHTYLEKL